VKKNEDAITITTIIEDKKKRIAEQAIEEGILALTEKLELANNLLTTLLEATHEFIVFGLDKEYRYLTFNNRHKEMAKNQWGSDIAIGTRIFDIIDNHHERENLRGFFERVLAGEQFTSIEEYEDNCGNVIVGKNHWSPIRNNNNEIIGLVCFMQDVSENRHLIKEMLCEKNALDKNMESMTFFDQLTGLYNRKFYDRELVRLDDPLYYPLSIILVSVIGMEKINFQFGQAFGEILIRKTVQVLKNGCRGDDVVARLEGDEYVILMPRTEGAKVERALKRIKTSLDEVNVKSVKLGVVFGHATKYDETENTQDIFKIAERHLERQKELEVI
jgi:diguanylate cyclase (GGDEF)-like protein